MKRWHGFLGMVGAACALSVAVSGCFPIKFGDDDAGTTPDASGSGCRAPDGRVVAVGGSFNDGCNDCTCLPDRGLVCTARACLPDAGRPDAAGPATCRTDDGREFAQGVRFMIDCNTCVCGADGRIVCTEIWCGDDAGRPDAAGPTSCHTEDGRTLRPGEGFNDGCNDCVCRDDGRLVCTTRFCPSDAGVPDARR
jgi:hypothetical protein